MKPTRIFLFASLAASILACSPGLGPKLFVSTLPEPTVEKDVSPESFSLLKIFVMKFADSRVHPYVAQIDGRLVEPEGDLGRLVQNGFEDALKARGAKSCVAQCPTVTGSIKRWDIKISPSFPVTHVEAAAQIEVSFLDPQQHVLYAGNYSGKTSGSSPYYTEDQITNTLGDTMNQAISAALSDQKLVTLMNQYS